MTAAVGCAAPAQPRSGARALALMSQAGPWLNTPAGAAPRGDGRIVLVNIWTYSCINSLRALPWLRAWHTRYRDCGLSVVGVHCPEFAFEHEVGNVRAALVAQGVEYPVRLDNDFALWRAFGNTFWPSTYLLDAQGRVRHAQSCEGGYDAIEQMIQRLLVEAGGTLAVPRGLSTVTAQGIQAQPSPAQVRVDETYLGHARGRRLAWPGGLSRDRSALYSVRPVRLGEWALEGHWTATAEHLLSDRADGQIALRFQARDVHLVMGTMAPQTTCRFELTLDGQAPDADHGIDVTADGRGAVGAPRLYQLVRQAAAVRERTLQIRFAEAGVQAYAFTFG